MRITAPADHATIENRGQAITLQTDGGVPPYTWLANRQLLRQSHSPQTLWQPPGDGDYDLDVSDQRGNHARIHIRLQTPPENPPPPCAYKLGAVRSCLQFGKRAPLPLGLEQLA